MPIEGFNYKEFAANLAKQANTVLPEDLSDEDKKYIVNIVNNFCYLAGEALDKDNTLNFNAEQASVITQFIGEWAFHKSIDLIRSKIGKQFRDSIMQKIAFTVFEIAKQAILKNLPQDQMIGVVEHHVKKVYDEALADLQKKGALSPEQFEKASQQSNIDEMAKNDNEAIESASDSKILKLAAFALVLKKLPQDRISTILTKFSPTDAKVLMQYLQIDDLETKIDSNIIMKCIHEMKLSLPEPKKVNINKTLGNFSKVLAATDIELLEQIVFDERNNVKSFILDSSDKSKFSPWIVQLICKHVEEKINDYKKEA